jgi:hypothetical protein
LYIQFRSNTQEGFEIAEVPYFFRYQVEHNTPTPLAMVSVFSAPDRDLLQESFGTSTPTDILHDTPKIFDIWHENLVFFASSRKIWADVTLGRVDKGPKTEGVILFELGQIETVHSRHRFRFPNNLVMSLEGDELPVYAVLAPSQDPRPFRKHRETAKKIPGRSGDADKHFITQEAID